MIDAKAGIKDVVNTKKISVVFSMTIEILPLDDDSINAQETLDPSKIYVTYDMDSLGEFLLGDETCGTNLQGKLHSILDWGCVERTKGIGGVLDKVYKTEQAARRIKHLVASLHQAQSVPILERDRYKVAQLRSVSGFFKDCVVGH